MNKEDAIAYMIFEIEKIERDRLANHMSIDANRQKREVVENIIKKLKDVGTQNEN